jgi:hypothetical protein
VVLGIIYFVVATLVIGSIIVQYKLKTPRDIVERLIVLVRRIPLRLSTSEIRDIALNIIGRRNSHGSQLRVTVTDLSLGRLPVVHEDIYTHADR